MDKVVYRYPYKKRVRKTPATMELREKHKEGMTLSPIDFLLKRNLISKGMHKAANYFVYLHSLKFGSKHLKDKVSNVYNFHEYAFRNDDEKWLEKQNDLLDEVIGIFKLLNSYKLILNVCIYEQFCFSSTTKIAKISTSLKEIEIFFTKQEIITTRTA